MKKGVFGAIFIFFGITTYAQFSPRQDIDQTIGAIRMVRTADFDQDGDTDVVIASFGFIAWYKNLDGLGTFGEPIPIQLDMQQSFNLCPADLDNDSKMDLVVSFFDEDMVVWYRNLGNGIFSNLQLIASGLLAPSGVTAADIDGDNDLDLVLGVSNGNGLYWVENLDGLGSFGPKITIDAIISQARTQAVGDIDSDGDIDILTNAVGNTFLSWFENVDGMGSFTIEHIIDPNGLYENSITLVDIDNDGDLDIVSQKSDLVIWRENIDGLGTFSNYNIISNQALNIFDTHAADLDNDGDQDVLSASTNDNKIAWYKNEGGLGEFGSQSIIDPNLQSPRTVHAADLNNDGDLDILSATVFQGSTLVWYENLTILGLQNGELDTSVSIHPNPAKNILEINADNQQIDRVKIFSVKGDLVQQVEGFETSKTVDVSQLASGMYYVQFTAGKQIATKKFIKQ